MHYKGLVNNQVTGMELRIVEGDLLDQDVDVIVNAWNRNIIPWWLLLPQGVSAQNLRYCSMCPVSATSSLSHGFDR